MYDANDLFGNYPLHMDDHHFVYFEDQKGPFYYENTIQFYKVKNAWWKVTHKK